MAREIDAVCRQAMARSSGSAIDWEPVNGFRLATSVERSEPLVRAMVAGSRQATGRRAVFGGVPGSADGTILRMQLGIPIVTCGPGKRLVPHQVDELSHGAVGPTARGRRTDNDGMIWTWRGRGR